MSIKELLSNKKYFMIKKKKIQNNLVNELNSELVDFFIYENNSIDSVYINDKEFMSFIDDKLCEYINNRCYIPSDFYLCIKEDKKDNANTLKCYEMHSRLNKCIDSLLMNKLFPKTIGHIIYNNLDEIINYGLMNILLEYSDGDCKINNILTSIDGFYEKYLEVIDKYIVRISEEKYNYYRKNIDDSSIFRCDGSDFYIHDLIDYIICNFPSFELVKENNLKIISKYKTRFEKQLYEKINIEDKNIVFLLERYIFYGINIENWFTSDFINIPKDVIDYIFNNFLDIICVNSKDIFSFIENVERIYGSEYSYKIIECTRECNECYINSMVNTVLDKHNHKSYKNAKKIVSMIVEDIMKNENINSYSDIKKIRYDRMSTVYKIGTKVFIIGHSKKKYSSNTLISKVVNFESEDILFEVQEYIQNYEEKNKMVLDLRKIVFMMMDIENLEENTNNNTYEFDKKYLKSNNLK